MLRGWSGSGKYGSLDTWNPNYKVVTATINFITATGRLKERRSTAEEGSEESKKKNSKLNRRLVTITHTLLSSGTSLNICKRDQRLSRRLRCYMISHSREIHSRNRTTSDNIWMGYLKKKGRVVKLVWVSLFTLVLRIDSIQLGPDSCWLRLVNGSADAHAIIS